MRTRLPDSRRVLPIERGIACALLVGVQDQLAEQASRHGISKLFGQRLRELRTARGLSQDALAEAVGAGSGVVSKVESGESVVSLDRLYALAFALKVEPSALLPSSKQYVDAELSTRRFEQLAMIALDERGELLFVDQRAEAILSASCRIAVLERRVHCEDPRVARWLQREREGCCWLRDGGQALRLELVADLEQTSGQLHIAQAPAKFLLLEWRELVGSLSVTLCEIAEFVAEGYSDKDIAQRSGRPLTTVRTYVARLYERTGLRSRAAVAKWWWTEQREKLGSRGRPPKFNGR